MPWEIALGLCLAIAVGGMVGLERERRAHTQHRVLIGGARTFPLVCLFGALSSLLAQAAGQLVLIAAFAATTVLLALGFTRTRGTAEDPQPGLTTEFAALLVFAIGAVPFVQVGSLDFPQRLLLAGALGTLVTALLVLREPLHEFVRTLSREDMVATVRFAVIALVVLPLLPDRAFDPFGALNPFRIGVVIVVIAGISFVGYIATRVLGARRGIGVTALAGGLVSSTAVTLTFAAKAREDRALAPACALAIGLAATVMFVRVLVEVAIMDPSLVMPIVAPLLAMFAIAGLGCLLLWRRAAATLATDESRGLTNPFRLRQALRLGLAYTVIRLIADIAWQHFGSGGLYVSAGLSGLADVDAITISVARMHAGGLETGVAVGAVTVAVVSNTLVKAGLAVFLGRRRIVAAVAVVLALAAAAGVVVGLLV